MNRINRAEFDTIPSQPVCRRSQRLKSEYDLFVRCELAQASAAMDAMDNGMKTQAEAYEEILTFDVPDAVLERAGSVEQKAFTLFYCTNPSYECGLPQ